MAGAVHAFRTQWRPMRRQLYEGRSPSRWMPLLGAADTAPVSLGLAPIVVGRLVRALDSIRADGTAIVVVEQSLNIAASAADRVVFLERGRVRFVGSGRDLLERRDLARSVFLGSDA